MRLLIIIAYGKEKTFFYRILLKVLLQKGGEMVSSASIQEAGEGFPFMDSARNRPARLQKDPTEEQLGPESEAMMQLMRQAVEAGMPPRQHRLQGDP